MSFPTDGYVLRAPRTAPANARSTGTAINGVSRDHKSLPSTFDYHDAGSPDDLFEVPADMYRTAVLDNANGASEEFLVWAANSSSFAVLETTDFTTVSLTPSTMVTIPKGSLIVDESPPLPPDERHQDGTDRLVVVDPAGRGIASVQAITIVRGDTGVEIQAGPASVPSVNFASQDPDAGVVVLDGTTLGALDGGVSTLRGDTISVCTFIVAAARFWWTKNDRHLTRFGWNGKTQRWEPLRGSPPKNLDILSDDGEYTLFPRPTRFTATEFLPGDSSDPTLFALVRVGNRPDAISAVPEVLVVSDVTAESGTVDFGALGDPDAVVGQSNGILIFNPDFIDGNAGLTVWYSPEQYIEDSNGLIGDMKEALTEPLFITPVPNATDKPFIRLGFRRYLTPVAKLNDAALTDQSLVPSGTVEWSMATGRLALSEADLTKADTGPVALPNLDFDLQFLGNQVYFDGVSLSTTSLRTPDPRHLVDGGGAEVGVPTSGKMYVRQAIPLPFPGVSGIKLVPDSSGQTPDPTITPATRENDSGLVRRVVGIGDTMVFTPTKAFDETEVVEFKKNLNDFPFAMRKTKVQIARELEAGDPGSACQFKRAGIKGEPIYFLQAEVLPAVYTADAVIYSREVGPFTFDGTETLYFAIDGTKHTWSASVGTFSAVDVAADILATATPSPPAGTATAVRDRVVLVSEFPTTTGSVEIGPGSSTAFTTRDNSAGAILGFLPGWRADATASENWLPDNGSAIGVSRSPLNKSRTNGTPDIRATSRFSNTILSNSLIANPQFAINNPPIQDIAGYDENIFFLAVDGFNFNLLENLTEVFYEFDKDRFSWLEQDAVTRRIDTVSGALSLGQAGVIGLTVHPAVATGNGFRLAEDGGALVEQDEGVGFLLPNDGLAGLVLPIAVVGGKIAEGASAVFSAGSTLFFDGNATLVTDGVTVGDRLHIVSGDAAGSYIIAATPTFETSVSILPSVPFTANAGPINAVPYASWRIHTGIETDTYDPAVVADVQYEQFNHLTEEPFKIRLLDLIGVVPASPGAQAASRLVAVVTEAFTRGRVVQLRFGLEPTSPSATPEPLDRGTELGTIANGQLYVPSILDEHFTTEKFSIRVGTKAYTFGGGDLSVVPTFTPALSGDLIEVASGTGLIKFGDATLSERAEAEAIYDEEFLDATDLAAGEAEYNPADGELNISAADIGSYAGTVCYWVERMITEDALDVTVSPVIGSFFFNRPLREGQLVEASYFAADSQGELTTGIEITEFLPVIVRLEAATFVDVNTFTVNPTGRTIDAAIETLIWADNELQNFGNTITVAFDDGTLSFVADLTSSAVVQVNYAVLEAFGGEQAYNTSTTPVYRPPFFLEADQDLFVLETDRTADMVPGRLLRLGPFVYYIKSSSYNATTDGTSVVVFPTQEIEAGSRAPGNDVLTLLSSVPVTPEVDGVSTGFTAAEGFLLTVSSSYEPVDKGMIDIIFIGDFSTVNVGTSPVRITAGHLLEMDGVPFIIAALKLAADGRTTQVTLTSPTIRSFNPSVDPVKLSVRPIYQPAPREFLGVAPFVNVEDFELVLFGETDFAGVELPGRVLISTIDYTVNSDDGSIEFLEPVQAALAVGQRLLFSYTRLKALSPFMADGGIVYPRYGAGYSHITTPSDENGLLGTTLAATYTFRNPDSFYYRTVLLEDYLGEVAQLAISRVQSQSPAGGAVVVSGASTDNFAQGLLGFAAQRRDLDDNDRAARTFIELYNAVVVAFEQVLETLNGEVIGDRDGKFRFIINHGKVYPPPGFDDGITGELNKRLVWSQVFRAANGSFGVVEADPVYDPETATIADPATMEIDGDPMNPFFLRFYIDEQKRFVKNDMDDRVLVDQKRPFFGFGLFQPRGQFRDMWEPHRISRLFPESTLAFSTTFPGLEADLAANPVDPGTYAFLKVLNPPTLQKSEDDEPTPLLGSTFLKAIGVISNPALDVITGISDIDSRARLPRARIWAYSPDGFPDIDALGLGATTAGFATVIATPTFIKDFPVSPDTGLPDFARLLTNNPSTGDTLDCGTGDPELSTPPFLPVDTEVKPAILQQVSFGRPSGTTLQAGNAQKTLKSLFGGGIDIDPIYGGVFVGDVQLGCLIILSDDEGNLLAGSDVLATGVDELSGSPIGLEQGDTIFVSVPLPDTTDFDDPPTLEQVEEIQNAIPTLNVGTKKKRGLWTDVSLPSWKDPFIGLKEMTGQKPPLPLSTIEADVDFSNNSREPLNLPALQGLPTNDSGDFTIPYMSFGNTELDRLGDVAAAFVVVGQTDGPAPQAVYPDEVIINDGEILAVNDGVRDPATLYTTGGDFLPITNGSQPPGATPGVYTPNSGYGDVARYDLMLVEVTTGTPTLPVGSMGILSVGEGTTKTLEPPRFISQTFDSDLIHYTLTNGMADVAPTSSVAGMTVTRAAGVTSFTITSALPILNDGSGPVSPTGGLNNIFAAANAIVIRLYENIDDASPGTLVEEIVFTSSIAHGAAAVDIPVTALTAEEKVIKVTSAAFVALGTLGTRYDFTITIDTWINTTTADLITTLGGTAPLFETGTGSTTGWIDNDRLTFIERFDMTAAQQRGTTLSDNLTVIEAGLEVWRVTAAGAPCNVNRPFIVNIDTLTTGAPLSLLERIGPSPDGTVPALTPYVGTYDVSGVSIPGDGGERGRFKVMAWEGVPLGIVVIGPRTGISATAIPSSDESDTGIICKGTGDHHDLEQSIVAIGTPTGGLVSNVLPGDILTIDKSATSDAAVCAGSYLVRHAIEDNSAADYREVALSGQAGPGGQFIDGVFPTIVSFVGGATRTVTVTDLGVGPAGSTNGTLWDDDTTAGNPFGASGMDRLFIIVRVGDITTVVSKVILNINTVTNTFTLAPGSALTADGVATISNNAFFNLLEAGQKVSGARFLPIGTSGSKLGSGLPSNSIVGYNHAGTTTYGFLHMVLSNTTLVGDASATNATFIVGQLPAAGAADGSEDLGVIEADVVDNKDFQTNREAVVYSEVAGWFDLNGLPTSGGTRDWEKLHGDTTIHGITLDGVRCLYPSDKFVAGDTADTKGNFDPTGIIGFQAEAGIFLEPSWARPSRPLNDIDEHVVDAARSVTFDIQIGMRDSGDFLLTSPESITFEVKRIRRFHEQLDAISSNLEPLRFAYETRRGVASSYTASTRTLVASTPTQLGDFQNFDVNINPGDEIRLIDSSTRAVLDTAEIASITDGTTVTLRKPGFNQVTAADIGVTITEYEIYLEQPVVPHEQSNEQLLELITEDTIFTSTATPSTGVGGFVTVVNELRDTTVLNFNDLNIQAGDIVIIEGAGVLEGPTGPASLPEKGSRPFGDTSVPDRDPIGPTSPYSPGEPAVLDDNRGFYRVVSIDPAGVFLTLTGASEFTGADGSDVVFGSTSGPTGTKYAVMPTISGSTTPTGGGGGPGTEGQQDLRITEYAGADDPDPNSYKGNQRSIAPFTYRVIRPSNLFSTEAIDLVLFLRERMLSFLEEMESPMSGGKAGNYHVFQRDEHITDVGSPTNPDEGLGIISNEFIDGLAGETGFAPFANVSDCLSILDRRFWALDFRLDSLVPPFGGVTPYADFAGGEGRPVLPDLVGGVLDVEDRFRQLRFAWIKFRTERVNGSLPAIVRFVEELPRRLEEQDDLLRLQEGLDNA